MTKKSIGTENSQYGIHLLIRYKKLNFNKNNQF